MNICPACKAKIDYLDWWSKAEGILEYDWQIQMDASYTKFNCPKCKAALFSNRDNAKIFLANETYPNDAAFYKCSRCGKTANKVYYHVWNAGDLCKECHNALEHTNMHCRVMDGDSTDILYSEDLECLWRMKLKTGKSITEQLLEAIEDYANKNLWAIGEDATKTKDQDYWRRSRW